MKPFILLIFLSLSIVTGCAAVLLGVGAGIGTFAYINGKLIRTYESEYHRTVRASRETLKSLKIPIKEEVSDELKTIIKAARPDGTPVTIEVARRDRNHTEVSVRTGGIGVRDKEVSMQIQGLINEKLAQSTGAASKYNTYSTKKDSPAATQKDTAPVVVNISEPEITTKKDSPAATQKDTAPAVVNIPEPEITTAKPEKNHASQIIQTEPPLEIKNQSKIRTSPKKENIQNNSNFVIYFDHDSNELSNNAIEKLDWVAQVLIEHADSQITVIGFSDSSGPTYYNKMISESRANTVKIYLIGKGAETSQIRIVGRGARNFIGNNATEEGRRLNRRVEIEFNRLY